MSLKKLRLAWLMMIGLVLPLAMAAPSKKIPTIAITLIVDHPALTETYSGVMAELKEQGFVERENINIIFANAHGNQRMAEQIAMDFVKQSPDVIVPISTPSAQAIIKENKIAKIPVVFSAVTDPIAAHLVTSLKQPGGYVTGVYDFPPVRQQLDIIREILPNIKTLGVLYNKSEINSVRVVERLKSLAQSLNIIETNVTSSDDVPNTTRLLAKKVDAIYIPADNTIALEIHRVLNIAMEQGIPVFTSEHEDVPKGALAALAYDPYAVGRLAARMVVDILQGKNPGTIPVIRPKNAVLTLNTAVAKELNIKIPDHFLLKATVPKTAAPVESSPDHF